MCDTRRDAEVAARRARRASGTHSERHAHDVGKGGAARSERKTQFAWSGDRAVTDSPRGDVGRDALHATCFSGGGMCDV